MQFLIPVLQINNKMKKLIATLSLSLLLGVVFCQSFNTAKLDSLFETLEANNKFMGSMAMSADGNIIYSKAVGKADIESGKNLDPNTKFRIGSISKMFTAVMILKAAEENKLTLDQTIDQYFPAIENADKISIDQLLTHHSGIHNFTNDPEYLNYHTQPKSEKELLDIITKGKGDFMPGSKGEYSNSNYVLLSFILEKVYRKKFSDILQMNITKPLGLANTFVGNRINISNNESNSYKFGGGWKKERETDMSIPLGAGAVVSNTSDLLKFIESLFAGKILSAASLEKMKMMEDGFGKGLFSVPFFDKTGYGHTGGIDGFQSVLYYFPKDNVGIVVLSNGTTYPLNDIVVAGLSAWFNKPFNLPSFKTITLKSEDLDQFLGEYSSRDMPLKITISKDGSTLIAQATGQSAIPMEAVSEQIFKFEAAGIILEFNASKKQMILKQGGREFMFTR